MINDFYSQRERFELISLPDLLPPLPPGTELSAEVFLGGEGGALSHGQQALNWPWRSHPLHHPILLAERRSFLERQSDNGPHERTRVIRLLIWSLMEIKLINCGNKNTWQELKNQKKKKRKEKYNVNSKIFKKDKTQPLSIFPVPLSALACFFPTFT